MPKTDPRVDAYIAEAAPFARPILVHLRSLVHRAAPAITETIKWGMPFFEHEGIVCHMAAFKAHCAFGFWRGGRIEKTGKEGEAMGQFGRIAKLADLPPDKTVLAQVKKAAALNLAGGNAARPLRRPKEPIPVPDDFRAALAGTGAAKATFDGFAPGRQREYLEWITEAKSAATRVKRIATAVEWLAEGQPRNWKYQRK
jgi:uncharacterized protein YdeI (YjbR/CyaY-like superfamily)